MAAGGFTLVDIDVAKVVPAEAMEPFAKELAAREARRERRAALEADKRLQETAREAAVAAAAAAPDASALLVRLQLHSAHDALLMPFKRCLALLK